MDFIEKRLLDYGVQIPKFLIPENPVDHILWPSFPCINENMNESLIDPLNIGYLMNSSNYIPDFKKDESKSSKNKYNKLYKNMKRSLRSGFLSEHEGFVLTKHIYKTGIERYGLLILLDYEKYEVINPLIGISKQYDNQITSEYVKFLSKAVFDMPYAQALIDDEDEILIEPLIASLFNFKLIFSFNHPIFGTYEGYLITTPQHYTLISNALTKIKSNITQNNKHLFLIHEGVESFESGKIHWENLKNKYGSSLYMLNPARFQLVELFNIYNPAIELIPCNILINNVSYDELISKFRLTDKIKVEICPSIRDLHEAILKRFNKYGSICYGLIYDDISYIVPHQGSTLAMKLIGDKMMWPKEEEKVIKIIGEYGNVISACIPIAWDKLRKSGNMKKGDKIVLVGTSAGVSIGGMVIKI